MLERLEVLAVLEQSASLGFLGPGPVADAVEHAAGFAGVLPDDCASLLDLGSGGGVPGLVLAGMFPEASVVLLDASLTRTDFLRRAVGHLGWQDRVRIVTGRAELLGRSAEWRGSQEAVVSRGFGPPALTAECAAPFLRRGGRLVVSEPPAPGEDRWPEDGLRALGLVPGPSVPGYAAFNQAHPCPPRFPRRSLQRPLF